MEIRIIQNKIFEFRGVKVMLDVDLAVLYEVETKVLNQAVKRNKGRFPGDFMFQLNKHEFENLMSQIVTSSWGGTRKLPYAFTEHGVTMLASVLRSKKAVQMNIMIVRAFIALRQIALHHKELSDKLDELKNEMYGRLGEHDTQLNAIYNAIENLLEDKVQKKNWDEREKIGYKR